MIFLSAESPILTKLSTVSVDGNTPLLLTAPDLEAFTDGPRRVPAIALVYAGMSVTNGSLLVYTERWVTWIIVRNVRAVQSGQPARADAGEWLDAINKALFGFAPDGYDSLQPAQPPKSGYLNGYAYHALAWDAPHKPIYCEA